ncbi:MAG: hypothetical protein JWQ20_2675 [Conexibacter sp.]|nr:hypothetical protein [Conexibacter sp.]
MLGWMDVRDRTRTLQPTMRPADGPVTALVITRRLNQAVRLTTADGTEIIITLRPGNVEGELRLAVEAPRSVVVHRPERDR